jgi:thymidine kinase
MTTQAQQKGYLEIVIGPMFSGKSSYLIEKYHFYQKLQKKICVINYFEDVRYSKTHLFTHNGNKIPALFIESLFENKYYSEDITAADVILINEGQFFKDLYAFVREMADNQKKIIHVSGLDGGYKRQEIGDILDIIPLCDKVTKLNSLCACGSDAPFTKRKNNDENIILIGGSDLYIACCRNCYFSECGGGGGGDAAIGSTGGGCAADDVKG